MKRLAPLGIVVALVVVGIALLADVRAAAPKTYRAQVSYTFVNGEAAPAYGLQVVLSGAADIKTNETSGHAGPFRDVRGNGTGTIILSNPDSPIEPGGEGFDLVFRSSGKKLSISSWWWMDVKGKRIGDKHKG